MELSVDVRQVVASIQEKLDLPQACCVDQERIPMRPVLAIAYGLVEPVQGGSIQFLCPIAATSDVEYDAYANQIHASLVRYGRGLMVDDADDDGPGLRRGKVRRVAGRVPSGTQDVEFRERLSRTRCEEDVSEGAGGDRDAQREGDREGLVEERIVLPASEGKDEGGGEPVRFGQPDPPPPRREANEDRERGNRRNDRCEPDSPWGEIQEEPEERDDRDAQPEAKGDPLDPVEFPMPREQGRDEDVARHEKDEENCKEVADVAQEQDARHDERVTDRDDEVPRLLLKMNPHCAPPGGARSLRT